MLDDLGISSDQESVCSDLGEDTSSEESRNSIASLYSSSNKPIHDKGDETNSLQHQKKPAPKSDSEQHILIGSKALVVIEMLGLGQQGKQTFAFYDVRVSLQDSSGKSFSSWNVIRRYSDFHTLYNLIIEKVSTKFSLIILNYLIYSK